MSLSRLALWSLVGLLSMPFAASAADKDGFETIFDGKTLEGWDGNPDFWSVKDGCITGQTTKDNPTKGNTFIIWRKGETADFELKLEYKIVGGNSGIQYRSFEVPNEKWVIGGYQGDFEAGDTYSGILYGERFRGILAQRGQKTVIGDDHKPKVVGSVGDTKEIQAKIKKEDWNEYHIIARGFEFKHLINGVTTCEVTDEDTKDRRASGLLALQLHAGPPMTVQFRNIRLKQLKKSDQAASSSASQSGSKKKVLFIAGKPSHGYGAHEHNAGCTLLARRLHDAMPNIDTQVVLNGWPQDKSVFDGVDAIVMYCDGGSGHMVNPHLDEVDALAKKGVGIVCLHYGVEVPKGPSGDKFLDWIGGYFEMNWSVNPHWTAKFDKFPEHPISRGVKPFEINDEWYYHMRFRPEMKGVTPILTALPPKETLNRGDGTHSGNPDVRKAVLERMEPQHVAWAAERPDGGRGFGFTGGHDHWNWGDPNFRKVVLNAIVWAAKAEVPKNGVEDKTVTLPDLEQNQDYPVPANFNRDAIKKQKNIPEGEGKQASVQPGKAGTTNQPAKAGTNVKPVFASKTVDPSTPNHSAEIDADISGAKQLYLVVGDAGDGFGCDWVAWAEPRLIGPKGETKLTDLKWRSAVSGHGSVQVNKNSSGGTLAVNGKQVEYGIGAHAVSVIAYDLPEGYTRFKARGGLDDGGTKQGCGSTVQFFVYTQQPPAQIASSGGPVGANAPIHEKENAVAGLEVADGLEAALFSAEPEISNVTTIDIDHQGRVWVGEVKNYRKFNGSRPEGDRILVLEDTNGDGKSDKSTVFYQGRDIDSVHGICVLGNKVIVSALDKVQVLTDENGDLKCDKKETLFSGISGSQHDHGIHAFQFGPDGKLYFNFGNEGRQIKDKNGKPLIDLDGNEINNKRQPYQEGMVFRCNLDGSEMETLGWNFRNNWEVTVDSFGTIWQSDNDDDGNKGVRINYVMEYGNYGYKDELTGAGWQQKRENWESDVPSRHWHLNDPGVVPTLLLTGAGSPTGICVYEGRLLPKVFWDQVIHTDAGPNVCRAYPVTKDGAGYKAEIVNILVGKKDNWFRPSDVCVAPDGSLFVGDWYDPGVGGHNQQEVDKGRIFRVAPPGTKYTVPKLDFSTVAGCIEALKNPCMSARYLAYTGLQAKGQESLAALEKLAKDADNPRIKARALWCAGKLPGQGQKAVTQLLNDANPDLRIVGIRLARELKLGLPPLAGLAHDKAPEVRRELAIACHHSQDSQLAANVWAELANQYDGKDRWYLEALGIGADKNWDACLAAWLSKASTDWNTPAGRDIIWRSRAKKTPELIGKILKDEKTSEEEQPRYYRALDFFSKGEKEAVLKSLLE
jgi:putative membrane-bound dehydrogenase-like protein